MYDRINVTRSSMPDFADYCNEIKGLWETRWLTNSGVKHEQLTAELKSYLGVDNIALVTNGHNALELAFTCLGLQGEVITTPFSFVSTTHAIARLNLTPVFCDINPDDYTIDVNKIEDLITEKTCAIVPVHVYGNICDVEAIEKIAQKYNLKVIYDAAHAFGEIYKETPVGVFGDASCYSFHATKVFHTIEGGAVIFKEQRYSELIKRIRDFGIEDAENVPYIGTNAKMNEFCAAMGLCNLKGIDTAIEKRKRVYEQYVDRLSSIQGIKINYVKKNTISNYAYFPICIDPEKTGISRDILKAYLEKHNIYTRKYFFPLISNLKCYQKQGKRDLPVANLVSNRILTLPMFEDLSIEQVNYICDLIYKTI